MKKKYFLLLLSCLSLSLIVIGQDSAAKKDDANPGYMTKNNSATGKDSSAAGKDTSAASANGTLTRKEKDALARDLKPADGKALVYILRPSGAAALIRMGVRCDGVHIGSTKAGNYVYTMLDPGKHVLMSTSENHLKMEITVEPGKIYYVKQEVLMGFAIAETDLQLLDEKDGLKYLKRCKLAKDNVASN